MFFAVQTINKWPGDIQSYKEELKSHVLKSVAKVCGNACISRCSSITHTCSVRQAKAVKANKKK